eukprot:3313817-Pyramimonas_sp.AAC.1
MGNTRSGDDVFTLGQDSTTLAVSLLAQRVRAKALLYRDALPPVHAVALMPRRQCKSMRPPTSPN